jgi:hypothetical protein
VKRRSRLAEFGGHLAHTGAADMQLPQSCAIHRLRCPTALRCPPPNPPPLMSAQFELSRRREECMPISSGQHLEPCRGGEDGPNELSDTRLIFS